MTRRSRAVVTVVHDEAVFLPIWLRYYARFFTPKDIYVIDHDTTDGSTSGTGFNRIPASHPVMDAGWLRDVLQAQQNQLIARYNTVLCTDVDEIIAPDPQTGDLGHYIDRFEGDFVTCRGYEILHMRDNEPPLDPGRPIMQQRRHWFFNPVYSKPLLARVPMAWHGGLHSTTDGQVRDDPSLHLIHLHRMDYDLCLARHRHRTAMQWNRRDLDENWGYQNRITDPEHFAWWFYNDSCRGVPITTEVIPDQWQGVI